MGKMYEKHRCRVNGTTPADEFTPMELAYHDSTHAGEKSLMRKKSLRQEALTGMKMVDLSKFADGTSRFSGVYKPRYTQPKPLPAGAVRNKFCELCGGNCAPHNSGGGGNGGGDNGGSGRRSRKKSKDRDAGDLGCLYCSAVYHAGCLRGLTASSPAPARETAAAFVCPDCASEIAHSKRQFEKEKMEIYEEHRERHYATLIAAKWRAGVAKAR